MVRRTLRVGTPLLPDVSGLPGEVPGGAGKQGEPAAFRGIFGQPVQSQGTGPAGIF